MTFQPGNEHFEQGIETEECQVPVVPKQSKIRIFCVRDLSAIGTWTMKLSIHSFPKDDNKLVQQDDQKEEGKEFSVLLSLELPFNKYSPVLAWLKRVYLILYAKV